MENFSFILTVKQILSKFLEAYFFKLTLIFCRVSIITFKKNFPLISPEQVATCITRLISALKTSQSRNFCSYFHVVVFLCQAMSSLPGKSNFRTSNHG